MRLADTLNLEGRLDVFERPENSRIWRPAGSWRNTVLNNYYSDLYYYLAARATNPSSPLFNGLLIYGGINSAGAITAGLQPNPGGYSALILTKPLPCAVAAGGNITIGAGGPAVTVGAAGASAGDYSIPLQSAFTPAIAIAQNTMPLIADTDIWLQQLALGFGNAPAARTDPGLGWEWQNFISLLSGTSIASGTSLSSIPLAFPLPVALASGATITTYAYSSGVGQQTATQQIWTVSANTVIGAMSIPVTAQNTSVLWYGAGATTPGQQATRIYYATGHTPQRMALTGYQDNTADPASLTVSFFLPAAANTVAVQFQEAGLFYNAPSGSAAGAGNPASHLLFSYQKGPNTDSRFDYTLTRS